MMRRSQAGQASFSRSPRVSHADPPEAESLHHSQLQAAYAEHDRVRQIAEDALELAQLRFDQLRLQETAEQERERLRVEREHVELAARVIELQKQHVPIPRPPPRAVTPPLPSPKAVENPPPAAKPTSEPITPVTPFITTNGEPKLPPSPQTAVVPERPEVSKPAPAEPQATPQSERDGSLPTSGTLREPPPKIVHTNGTAKHSTAHLLPGIERYKEIHVALKNMRKFMIEEAKTSSKLQKGKVGDMRRALRIAVGQLTDVKGANREPNAKIHAILREALTLPSTPVDPGMIVAYPPPPTEGSPDKLPVLFIYLLNILSKVVMKQFIEEAGVNSKAAEPIGVIAVSIFAKEEFQWRGKSLIDILMAKFRIVCPVVFGIRGDDKTEEGRARQGWRKEEGQWVPEQTHNTRMTGLGAGYSAIALRDFTRTKMQNPWPPCLWWKSLASMVSTPEPSGTQYLVVKAMVDGYEQRFLSFYGSAGKAALQAALVEFPRRDLRKTVAATSLATLADKLKKDVGLRLA